MSTLLQAKPMINTASRINWSKEEALAVARVYYAVRAVHPELRTLEVLERAQRQVLVADRRRVFEGKTSSVAALVTRLADLWTAWAKKNEADKQADILAAEQTDLLKHRANMIDKPVITEPVAPVPVALPVPQLGALELALTAIAQQAVAGSMASIITELKAVIAEQTETIQSLMNAQHDSLMSYWDEDFKRSRSIQAEYLNGSIATPAAQLEQVRIRRKKVLVVATNPRGTKNALEAKFAGVDFVFVDGASNRLHAEGFYDLVLCNATNKPAVKDKLARMHGVKTVYTDGGIASLVDIIRKRLGI